MGKIFVVGVGPGSDEFLTPCARKIIDKADILVGGNKILSSFKNKRKKVIDKDLEEIIGFIGEHKEKNIAVLTSGDPGFYSILALILKKFPKEEIEVIPGISSMQLCFAKIKEIWHDAKFISLHGRNMDILVEEIKDHPKIAILTDPSNPPNKIAELLIQNNIPCEKIAVCENLSLSSEKVILTSVEEVFRKKFSGNCVVVIFR
ncbi:MAG: precorrin-6y C5,15-methyltransferase (decarboxylating) subunit CbiE [Candidatus Hydrothermarchaeota archaeon]